MKLGLGLRIHISKFKGYDSELDIYIIRADFEKLIEPILQRKLSVDYLKMNCLAGMALTIVGNIENIDDVCKRLIDHLGNTRILLQNKVSALP